MIINDANIIGQVYGQIDFNLRESETREILLDRVNSAVNNVAKEINMNQSKEQTWDQQGLQWHRKHFKSKSIVEEVDQLISEESFLKNPNSKT